MPSKNEIDWNTRQTWLNQEISQRLDWNNEDLDTLHKCIKDINVSFGVLSVSQIYRALQDYSPKVIVPKNQLKISL
jgi:hypothetical protein